MYCLGIGFGMLIFFVGERTLSTMVFLELLSCGWTRFGGGGGTIFPSGEMSNLYRLCMQSGIDVVVVLLVVEGVKEV